MTKLARKVAIVTGASKGIGADIALGLAAAGAKVAVNYLNDKIAAHDVVRRIEALGGVAMAVCADITNRQQVRFLLHRTVTQFGKLDVLINNAGIYDFAAIEDVTEEQFYGQFATNVLGPIITIQEALQCFNDTGGSIVNISSIASANPPPGALIYASSKGALDVATLTLARELAPRHIRVNGIRPGPTKTEGTMRTFGHDSDRALAEGALAGRAGTPSDITPLAVFLASDESYWVTGEIIRASGGQH